MSPLKTLAPVLVLALAACGPKPRPVDPSGAGGGGDDPTAITEPRAPTGRRTTRARHRDPSAGAGARGHALDGRRGRGAAYVSFRFDDGGVVVVTTMSATRRGRWEMNGPLLTITFDGGRVYHGGSHDDTLYGTARDGAKRWEWTVFPDEAL